MRVKYGGWFLLVISIALFGCQPTTSDSKSERKLLTGKLIDSPVGGATYSTETQSGMTDAEGSFHYYEGEEITFFIGNIRSNTISTKSVITPLDFVGAADESDPRVINLIRFVQSLDNDGDPSNGIEITEETRNALSDANIEFDQSVASFEAEVSGNIATYTAQNEKPQSALISATDALLHFKDELANLGILTQLTAPQEINLSTMEVAENTDQGTKVITLSSKNPNNGNELTQFELLSQSSTNVFSLSNNELIIADASYIDFENATTVAVTLKVIPWRMLRTCNPPILI